MYVQACPNVSLCACGVLNLCVCVLNVCMCVQVQVHVHVQMYDRMCVVCMCSAVCVCARVLLQITRHSTLSDPQAPFWSYNFNWKYNLCHGWGSKPDIHIPQSHSKSSPPHAHGQGLVGSGTETTCTYMYTHTFSTLHLGHTKPLMFSTTPITGRLTFRQKLISLRTSRRDTSCVQTRGEYIEVNSSRPEMKQS